MRDRKSERDYWHDDADVGQKELELANALGPHYPEFIQSQRMPSLFKMAVSILHQAGMLNINNLDAAFEHCHPDLMAKGLVILKEIGILEGYQDFIAKNFQPDEVAEAFEFLLGLNLLTTRNCDLVALSAVPKKLATLIQLLHHSELTIPDNIPIDNLDLIAQLMIFMDNIDSFNKRNFYTLKALPKEVLHKLLSMVHELESCKLINQENFNALIGFGNNIDKLMYSVTRLKSAYIFDQLTFELILSSVDSYRIVNAMLTLHEHQLLTYEVKKNLATSDMTQLDIFMSCLEEEHLLTQENLDLLLPVRPNLSSVSFMLHQANILTQANLEALILDIHSALLTEEAQFLFWHRMPFHGLTQEFFTELLRLSRQNLPLEVFITLANEMVEELDNEFLEFEEPEVAVFNHAQSIHTESVESSIEQAAQKLMTTYGHTYELEQKIDEVKDYILGLTPSFKNDAAKRCINRITDFNYVFTNPTTGISIRQCLSLVYVAIHDASRCDSSLENAKLLFVDALYEIQRGYNIVERDLDNEADDQPICPGGTFNKLIEKLWSIHILCPIKVVNNGIVNARLQRVIHSITVEYLLALTPLNSLDAVKVYNDLLSEIIKNGVEIIWDEIKPEVSSIMHQEFNGFPGLETSIDNGRYFNQINDPRLQQQMDYIHTARQSNDVLNDLNQHYFWSNRHVSPQAQMHFDRRYGLLP